MAKKAVIFDDDDAILSICRYILEEEGWEVATYNDCNNIETKIYSEKPNIILMDNWIPDTGGMVATRTLKANQDLKNIPVIYFSANNDIASLAKEATADDFLAKPFDIDQLMTKINGLAIA